MIKRIINILIICLIVVLNLSAQNNIVGGEYWIDKNFSGRTSFSTTASKNIQFNTNIDMNALEEGLHIINFRFIDENNIWSSVSSKFFIKRTAGSGFVTREVVSYEYWFDSDFSARVEQGITQATNFILSQNLDISALNNGLHIVHYRFKDSDNVWSSVKSNFFAIKQIGIVNPSNEIISYEYWFDNDYNNRTEQTLSAIADYNLSEMLDVSSLKNGLHTLHYRFKDAGNVWSSVISKFIVTKTMPAIEQNNKIVSYRFWIDGENMTEINLNNPANDLVILDSIELYTTHKGEHMLTMQFKDSLGVWSSPITDTIEKIGFPIAYFNSPQTLVCDTATIAFYADTYDADSILWSVNSTPVSGDTNLLYFFDNPGINYLELTAIDTSLDIDSTYLIEIFVDSITSDLITDENYAFCSGDSTLIEALSGYNYLWSTGDTNQNIYAKEQDWYVVEATSIYNCTSEDSVYVMLNELPSINLGSDRSKCGSDTLRLGQSYPTQLWNGINGDSTLVVDETGQYVVNVFDQNNCTASDSIYVVIHSAPQINLGEDRSNCIADTLVLNNSYASQTWNGTPGDSSLVVSESGLYIVEVTDINNCIAGDSIYLIINNIPPINLGEDQTNCGPDTLIINGDYESYTWNGTTGDSILIINESGLYIAKVTDVNNCSNKDSIYMTIFENPEINLGNNQTINENESIDLNAGDNFDTYLWSDNTDTQINSVNGSSLGIGNHTIAVTVTDLNNCSASDTVIITVTENVNTSQIAHSDIKLYPVPVSEILTIEIPETINNPIIKLYNTNGDIVYVEQVYDSMNELDLSKLPSGNYVLMITSRSINYPISIIKK